MKARNRAGWLKTLHHWHWISSALCLAGMLLFALTGITLNHATQIGSAPEVESRSGTMPDAVLASTTARAEGPLPREVRDWLGDEFGIDAGTREPEWSDDEIYVALPRPGGDGWVAIDRASGSVEIETTDRGWISYINDLHKGRNTGAAWAWFLDVFALACIVFCITGFFLLQLHARQRGMTWPLVGAGLVIPLLLIFLLIH